MERIEHKRIDHHITYNMRQCEVTMRTRRLIEYKRIK